MGAESPKPFREGKPEPGAPLPGRALVPPAAGWGRSDITSVRTNGVRGRRTRQKADCYRRTAKRSDEAGGTAAGGHESMGTDRAREMAPAGARGSGARCRLPAPFWGCRP